MIYTYEHPVTGEKKEIVQKANDIHKFIDEEGVSWNRVFHAPYFAIDSTPDITSEKGFMKYTEGKKGNMGNLFDLSAEASSERADRNGGIDPVKQKGYEEYRKKHGQAHKDERKETIKKELKSKGIEVEF